jgi:radical SAM superfamily enzyme YgiQ (UPF0313 family)
LISAPTANDFDDPQVAESDAVRTIAEHAPLGILSLAAVLEHHGIVPEIIDLNRLYYEYIGAREHREPGMDFCAFVASHFQALSFDVWGFSTICSSYPLTLRIAAAVKRIHPEASIVLGGPQASVVDVQTMTSLAYVDFIVRGEAEDTLPMLLDSLSAGRDCSGIPGITYRRGQDVLRNHNAPVIDSLDRLPFPAFHLYPHMSGAEHVSLELGRGCPFACTFCSTNDFFRRRFRLKTPAHIIEEMKRVKETFGIITFDLVHDMFTVDRKRVVAFCDALLGCGEKFYWGCSARTDCVDDELIALMARAGCRGIFFGIESGSARMQKIFDKGLDLPEAIARIKTTDRYKIRTAVSLITGFPEETTDDLRDTIGFFMDSMRFDYADPQLCLLAPLAETPIETEHRGQLIFDDIISDMSFQGWRQDPADREMIAAHPDIFSNFYSVPTPWLDRQYLKELREFILNGMVIFRWLLTGLHQDSGDLLEVFTHWRAWREANKGPFREANPTLYYAGAGFHSDFLEFVRSHYLVEKARATLALSVLADYEAAFDPKLLEAESKPEESEPVQDFGGMIGPSVVPVPASGIKVVTLGADYGKIVRCLRRKGRLARVPRREVTLVTRESPEKRTEVLQLSAPSAELLALCDGKRTVSEVADQFSLSKPEVDGVPAAKACVLGLELLRRQGLVVIASASGLAGAVPAPLQAGTAPG